jgi:hypothetical protein
LAGKLAYLDTDDATWANVGGTIAPRAGSTFSAVKREFGDAVRSKSDVAMVNEVLCKFLCHNLCCLIQEQEELGITPVFFKDETPAQLALVAPAIGQEIKTNVAINECASYSLGNSR